MAGRRRADAAPAAIAALADVDRMEAHEGLVVVGNRGKSGHTSQLKMRVQDADGLWRRTHLHGRLAQFAHRVDHQRRCGDVVEVRMGEEDMNRSALSSSSVVADARPAVDQMSSSSRNEVARLRPPIPAAAPQHFELHGLRHPRPRRPEATVQTLCET